MADVAGAGLVGDLGLQGWAAHGRGLATCDFLDAAELTRADVDRLADGLRPLQRQQEGAGDVGHMHEVALLGAVLEHHGRGVVGDARGEDGQHAGIGIGERLAGAVDVPQTQRHALHAVLLAEGERQPLLHIFVDGVDAAQRYDLGLGRRRGDQGAALAVQRVPGSVRIAAGAHHLLIGLTVGVAVEALAIDAHG